jgi:hypothetical protein
VALLATGGLLAFAPLAMADATPVQLVLSYVPKISNTGSQAATGIAELVMPEGEVRVSATGLPRLSEDGRYVAWVLNTQTNEFLRLGSFNSAQSTNALHFEEVLPDAIPDKQWNLFLVTVEYGDTPAEPSSKHSIAGVFPRLEADPPPALLPNTGGAPDAPAPTMNTSRPEWLPAAGLAALVGSVSAGAGYGAGKRHARIRLKS